MPYIPHTDDEIKEMLETIGVSSIDDMFDEIPSGLREVSLDAVPTRASEQEVSRIMAQRADQVALRLGEVLR